MEKKSYVIGWENIYSHETGYVKSVRKTKGYFENSFEQAEAKTYRSEKAAQADLDWLRSSDEAVNNVFAVR